MVMQKTLDNLKDRPKEDRKVVALGAAGTVMVALLIGWAFLFVKNLERERAASQLEDISADIVESSSPVQQSATYTDTQGGNDQFGMPDPTGSGAVGY